MYFAQPWMLWGMLGIVIPVIAHFLRGKTEESIEWAAFRFLERAQLESRSRLRIEDYVLLIVRMLMIAALVTALAVPTRESTNSGFASNLRESSHQYFAIDLSYSMGRLQSNQPTMDFVKEFLSDQIAHDNSVSRYSIYGLSDSAATLLIQRMNDDREEVLKLVNSLQSSEQSLSLVESLQSLLAQIEAETNSESENNRLTLITDFQALNWNTKRDSSLAENSIQSLLDRLSKYVRIKILVVGDDGQLNNSRIAEFDINPKTLISGETATFDLAIRNDGREPMTQSLALEIGDVQRAKRQITVNERSTKKIRIPLKVAGNGFVEVVAKLRSDSDVLATDNTRYQSLNVRSEIRVLLVSDFRTTSSTQPIRTTDFVQVALESVRSRGGTDQYISTTTINSTQLIQTDLKTFDCIVLSNVGDLDQRASAPLQSFVNSGGGLICGMGNHIDVAQFNRFAVDGGELFPEIADASDGIESTNEAPISFAIPEGDHPITKPFGNDEKRGLTTSPIDRAVRLKNTRDFKTILRFSNGAPAILEKQIGHGTVIFFANSLDDSWGFWPYWPSYVPLITESVRYATLSYSGIRNVLVSEPISIPDLKEQTSLGLDSISLVSTESEDMRLPKVGPSLYKAPNQSGIFQTAKEQNGTEQIWVVNTDPAEADLTTINRDDIQRIAAALPVRIEYLTDRTVFPNHRRDEPTRPKLTVLCLLLLSSLVLSEQVMRKRFSVGVILLSVLIAVNLGILLLEIA